AHPSVFDIFLQILDEGIMHDRLGKEGDFSNALILFTSNIGSDWIGTQFDQGLIPAKTELMDRMTAYFRPEFLARLSDIVPFAPISSANLVRIFLIQLATLQSALQQQGIALHLQNDAGEMLATAGFNHRYGARQLATVTRNELKRPRSKLIVSGQPHNGHTLWREKNPDQQSLSWIIKSEQSEIV